MSTKRKPFSPEFREQAAKLVIDSSRPIAQVAREIGVNEQTLGTWVHKYRKDHASEEPALGMSEQARLKELERLNKELQMEVSFLKKCSSYFAQNHS